MSSNRRIPFELCNTAIKEYYFKLFATYFVCSIVSILALEVQQHMLKKVNNACPSLPFTHIKAMVNSDTTVFRFIEIFFLLFGKNKAFCMCTKQLCMRWLFFVVIRSLGISRWLWAEVAYFKLACVGNLAFKGDQSRNVIWHDKHNDLVIGWVQNKERENNTMIIFY